MSASAPGSRTGRSPYEALLSPEDMNGMIKKNVTAGNVLKITVASLTFTASKIRMALARSFSLRQARSAASRIFGSGTRS